MSINQIEKDNLFKGLGLFLEGFRPYVVSILMSENGEDWAEAFADSLSPGQKSNWTASLKNGMPPEAALDFHHFKSFAVANKFLLKDDFGKKVNSVPTWLGEI